MDGHESKHLLVKKLTHGINFLHTVTFYHEGCFTERTREIFANKQTRQGNKQCHGKYIFWKVVHTKRRGKEAQIDRKQSANGIVVGCKRQEEVWVVGKTTDEKQADTKVLHRIRE